VRDAAGTVAEARNLHEHVDSRADGPAEMSRLPTLAGGLPLSDARF
jgi:hypothetical protein